jgi:hypothetical protein
MSERIRQNLTPTYLYRFYLYKVHRSDQIWFIVCNHFLFCFSLKKCPIFNFFCPYHLFDDGFYEWISKGNIFNENSFFRNLFYMFLRVFFSRQVIMHNGSERYFINKIRLVILTINIDWWFLVWLFGNKIVSACVS